MKEFSPPQAQYCEFDRASNATYALLALDNLVLSSKILQKPRCFTADAQTLFRSVYPSFLKLKQCLTWLTSARSRSRKESSR